MNNKAEYSYKIRAGRNTIPVIEKGTNIPFTKKITPTPATVYNNQIYIEFSVVRERDEPDDWGTRTKRSKTKKIKDELQKSELEKETGKRPTSVEYIGGFVIEGIPPSPRGRKIDIIFNLDEHEDLDICAKDLTDGRDLKVIKINNMRKYYDKFDNDKYDHHWVLGVDEDASYDDIETAYQYKRYLYPADSVEEDIEKIIEYINTAYCVLSNPTSRERYLKNKYIKKIENRAFDYVKSRIFVPPGVGVDKKDIENAFKKQIEENTKEKLLDEDLKTIKKIFNSDIKQLLKIIDVPPKPPDIPMSLEISHEEATSGCIKTLIIKVNPKGCVRCHEHFVICSACNGTGQRYLSDLSYDEIKEIINSMRLLNYKDVNRIVELLEQRKDLKIPCMKCRGTGKMPCPNCTKEISVEIPPGTKNGAKIRIPDVVPYIFFPEVKLGVVVTIKIRSEPPKRPFIKPKEEVFHEESTRKIVLFIEYFVMLLLALYVGFAVLNWLGGYIGIVACIVAFIITANIFYHIVIIKITGAFFGEKWVEQTLEKIKK